MPVKPMQLWMLSVAAVALPGLALADVIRQSSDKTVEGAGIQAVRIENSRGAVNVRPSSDGRIPMAASSPNSRRRCAPTRSKVEMTAMKATTPETTTRGTTPKPPGRPQGPPLHPTPLPPLQ